MRLLAFSDLHRDERAARSLAERAADVDVVPGVGDFATKHRGLEATIDALREIDRPVLLVPGNNETEPALRAACEGWPAARVLHGDAIDVDGVTFFGLGGAVPETPFDWSFDLTEEQAEGLLQPLPDGAVLLVHSPPKGHVDGGLGSIAVLHAIEARQPQAVLCGHVHDCWGQQSRVGRSSIRNLGPAGAVIEVAEIA